MLFVLFLCVCSVQQDQCAELGVTTLDSPFLVFEGKVVLIPKYRLLGGEKTFFSPKTKTRAILLTDDRFATEANIGS